MDFVTIIILVNVFIYVLPFIFDFSKGYLSSNDTFLAMFWQQSDLVKSGEYYRLITSQFLHGGLAHIFFNMYTLWQVKYYISNMYMMLDLPKRFASINPYLFLFVYLATGVLGGLTSVFTTRTPSVGASGAILGIFGFFTAYAFTHNQTDFFNMLVMNILLIAVIGFFVPNIDNAAHAGGYAGGIFLYILMWIVSKQLV
jgi:rhomboid protease GluP